LSEGVTVRGRAGRRTWDSHAAAGEESTAAESGSQQQPFLFPYTARPDLGHVLSQTSEVTVLDSRDLAKAKQGRHKSPSVSFVLTTVSCNHL